MRVIFTVTNDLNFDQRMQRICRSLAEDGFSVLLVGVHRPDSEDLNTEPYEQKRLKVWFQTGPFFYLNYNLRLFFFLLFARFDTICCIDLDTMLPAYFVSKLRNKNRVYDAHEYFSQQKEIISRPKIYKVWHWIEKTFVPKFKTGYTVSQSIAEEFKKLYGVNYELIRNVPILKPYREISRSKKIILYQGSVNEARGFEVLIPAMKNVDAVLMIYGDGNFMDQTRALIHQYQLSEKIILAGKVAPALLQTITRQAYIGINLVEPIGLNQYFSLANKFFDYMHQGIPQITMDFPEYRRINESFEVALLLDELTITKVEEAIQRLLNDPIIYRRLKTNSLEAREHYHWQIDKQKLIEIYKTFE